MTNITTDTTAIKVNAIQENIVGHATSMLELAREAGAILTAKKERVSGSMWQNWVKNNLTIGVSTASRYMRIAEEWEMITSRSRGTQIDSIRGAITYIATERTRLKDESRAANHRPPVEPVTVAPVPVVEPASMKVDERDNMAHTVAVNASVVQLAWESGNSRHNPVEALEKIINHYVDTVGYDDIADSANGWLTDLNTLRNTVNELAEMQSN